MSSILKALQKVEEEKAARDSGRSGVADNRLRSGRGEVRSPQSTFIIMFGVAAVAVLTTYLFMGGFSGSNVAPPRQMEASAPKLPVPNAPVESPQTVAPLTAILPVGTSGGEGRVRTIPLPAAKTKVDRQQGASSNKSLVPVEESLDGEEGGPVKHLFTEKPAVAAAPVLKVSGIAWQKEGAGSVAVVNGHSIMAGGNIDGFSVEEILPDRVRFAKGGKTFDLYIGESKGTE